MAHDFRLGPAILKAEDSPHLPETWRDSLLRKHLDGPARAVLAQCNKTALSLLLSEWPEAALTIRVQAASAEPPARLLCRMHRAQQQVAQRGSKGTQLHVVEQGEIPAEDAWWLVTFASLARSTTIASLSLQLSHMPPDLFHFIGPALPALATLTLSSPDGQASAIQLPAPTALPALRGLSLLGTPAPGGQAALWDSVGPYLPQLTSLVIGEHCTAAEPSTGRPLFEALFVPAFTTHTLTSLDVPCSLTPRLTQLLQQHTPTLRQLSVHQIDRAGADPGAPVAPVCWWHTVRCEKRGDFPVGAWEWLPLPVEGKLGIEGPGGDLGPPQRRSFFIDLSLPVSETVAHKVTGIEFSPWYHYKIHAESLQPHEQPAALRAALPILAINKSVGNCLILEGFTMSAAIAVEVAAAAGPDGAWCRPSLIALTWPADAAVATPLPPLTFLHLSTPLNDNIVAQLMHCVQQADTLHVPALGLQAARPEGLLPFRTIEMHSVVQLLPWLNQLDRLGHSGAWKLRALQLPVDALPGDEAEIERSCMRLRQSRLGSLEILDIARESHVYPPVNEEARLLCQALRLARALPCTPSTIQISHFIATDETVRELRGLPTTCKSLSLRLRSGQYSGNVRAPTVWPLSRAAVLIPRSYTHWTVSSAELREAELEAFLLNAPHNRTAEEPLCIEIVGKDKAWVDGIMGTMTRLDTYPHVTVVTAA